MNITEFLEARIAEDEAAAKERSSEAPIHYSGCYYYSYSLDDGWFCDCDEDGKATARVLAECAAKRAIIEDWEDPSGPGAWEGYDAGSVLATDKAVRALAAVYKDHPDYQQEWSV